jgi:hypothetical protein
MGADQPDGRLRLPQQRQNRRGEIQIATSAATGERALFSILRLRRIINILPSHPASLPPLRTVTYCTENERTPLTMTTVLRRKDWIRLWMGLTKQGDFLL